MKTIFKLFIFGLLLVWYYSKVKDLNIKVLNKKTKRYNMTKELLISYSILLHLLIGMIVI